MTKQQSNLDDATILAARVLGRRGGLRKVKKGLGAMPLEQRRQISMMGVIARWGKIK